MNEKPTYEQLEKRVAELEKQLERRQREEKQLRLSEKKFSKVFRSSPDSIIISSLADGRYIDVNESFLKATGYSREEIIGKTSIEMNVWAVAEDRDRFVKILLDQGHVTNFEAEFGKKDGTTGFVLMSAEFIEIEAERCLLTVSMDITQLKLAMEELRQNREKLKGILDAINDCMVMIDEQLTIVWANSSSRLLFGGDPVGKKCYGFLNGQTSACRDCIGKKTFSDGKVHEHEISSVTGKGMERHYWCVSSVVARKKNGKPRLVVETYRDITERIEKEAEERRRKAAEEANKTKSEFLAVMSHEIRTPISIILGMSDMIAESDLSGRQEEYLRLLKSAGENLRTIIDDVLDLSKVEAGQLELEEIDFDLSAEIHKVWEVMHFKAAENGIRLEYRLSEDVPAKLLGDPCRLRQILINLVGNAIKFTDQGYVRLSVKRDGNDRSKIQGKVQLNFAVTDTGIGIAPEKHSAIFESFAQANTTTTRTHGGTGLGLAICKRLVEMMDGAIGISSTPGKGSRFFFTARFKKSSGSASAEVSKKTSRTTCSLGIAPRILLVEDSIENRMVFEFYSKNIPCKLDFAEDGKAGLEKFTRGQYDIIFMDIEMPVMDGNETARRMRAWEKEKGRNRVPIVALTAHAMKKEREKFFLSGMDGFIIKPIDAGRIYSALVKHLDSPLQRADGQAPAHPAIDNELALRCMGGKDALFRKMLAKFVQLHENAAGDIRKDMENGNYDAARIRGHTIKSVASYIVAEQLQKEAEALETAIRASDMDDIKHRINRFETALNRAIEQAKSILEQE